MFLTRIVGYSKKIYFKIRYLIYRSEYILKRTLSISILILITISGYGQEILSSHTSGFYDSSISITLSSNTAHTIRYSQDGSLPTVECPIYLEPVLLAENNAPEAKLSQIRTNPASSPEEYRWSAPDSEILRSHVIKAALFDGDKQVSDVYHFEYFIGDIFQEISLPIMSMYIDSSDFFSYDSGIYVPGADYDQDSLIWQPGNYFNRGDDWERIVSLRYYDEKKEVLYQKAEAEIHGGASRVMPCKSIRLSAKKSLGTEYFDHHFFNDKSYTLHKRLILRNSGQDWHQTLFLDALMHNLLSHEDIEYQSSTACLLFINGEYWGIHNLRERYDKHYFYNYHDLDKSDIDYLVVEMAYNDEEGSSEDYQSMINMILDPQLSDNEKYEKINVAVDLDNFIVHHISKVYGGGTDWAGNNTRIWRSHDSNSKWRWVANDYDDAFMVVDKDSYDHATKDDGMFWPNPEWSTRLFRFLMTVDSFQNRYRDTLEHMLATTFSQENIDHTIDSLAMVIRSEMPRQINRWNHPANTQEWEENIVALKAFAGKRKDFVLQNFNQYFPEKYLAPAHSKVYPNPASDFINIELDESYIGKVSYTIYDHIGKKVQSGTIEAEQVNFVPLAFAEYGVFSIQLDNTADQENILFTRM